MKTASIEDRLADLEKKVADLESQRNGSDPSKDWLKTVGMFTGDEVMKRIDEHARKYREADRQKARRRKKRATK